VTANWPSAQMPTLPVSDAIERTARVDCHSQRNQGCPPALRTSSKATVSPKGQAGQGPAARARIAEGNRRTIPLVEYQGRLTAARGRLPATCSTYGSAQTPSGFADRGGEFGPRICAAFRCSATLPLCDHSGGFPCYCHRMTLPATWSRRRSATFYRDGLR